MFQINNNNFKNLYSTLFLYPAPINLTYFWNFGIYAIVALLIQIVTGILLAMHYIPHLDFAFLSVEHIMRDINNGWLLRYTHSNGASLFFIVVYIHMFRGLYYGSYLYPNQSLWIIGVIIFLLMIITAFFGKNIAKDDLLICSLFSFFSKNSIFSKPVFDKISNLKTFRGLKRHLLCIKQI